MLVSNEAQEFGDLPLIPLPDELKQLPPLPEEQEKVMRTLARHAIELFLEQYRDNNLQPPKKGNSIKEENG